MYFHKYFCSDMSDHVQAMFDHQIHTSANTTGDRVQFGQCLNIYSSVVCDVSTVSGELLATTIIVTRVSHDHLTLHRQWD